MATKILKLTLILSLLISLALFVSSNDDDINHHDMEDDDEDEEEFYVVDTSSQHHGSRSRFLANIIKKGKQCNLESNNVCNGVKANKGRDLLFCCKKHCRNVLSDKNNCGVCGQKCNQGQRCCNGVCTNVLSNVHHCGKCNNECSAGHLCGNGFCGYA